MRTYLTNLTAALPAESSPPYTSYGRADYAAEAFPRSGRPVVGGGVGSLALGPTGLPRLIWVPPSYGRVAGPSRACWTRQDPPLGMPTFRHRCPHWATFLDLVEPWLHRWRRSGLVGCSRRRPRLLRSCMPLSQRRVPRCCPSSHGWLRRPLRRASYLIALCPIWRSSHGHPGAS